MGQSEEFAAESAKSDRLLEIEEQILPLRVAVKTKTLRSIRSVFLSKSELAFA